MSLGSRFSQHSFAQIPSVHMARSQFDRSHTAKDTFDFDYLIPCYVDEVIPGDTINLSVSHFARLATQLVPIMDNMWLDYFFFFVPNRLVYANWEKLCGAQDNPGDSTDFIAPYMIAPAVTGFDNGSIFDHFGLPTGAPTLRIDNTMPLRCYLKIWNDWFRDQNMQDSVVVPTDAGPDVAADFPLLKRGKRHDYFTSCLPWPQKGPDVTMPLGTSALVKLDTTTTTAPLIKDAATMTVTGSTQLYSKGTGILAVQASTADVVFDPNTTLYADLAAATAPTINAVREAFSMQSLFELDARGGTRFVEILRAHYNVISPDFRLQRAEFLGMGSASITSHPVAQQSPTSGSNYMASLAAFGTSATSGNRIGFTKSFVEHGYVIGLVCARGEVTYQQGLNRMWSKSTRYDFFWPKLQELGEQAVLNKEIYAQGGGAPDDEEVFGYQERYAEYRYKPSEIRGQFRSNYTTPLDMWHLAEEFAALPQLNEDFIGQNTPVERALASATAPHIMIDYWFQIKHARPMLTYSVPATIGRF